MTDATVLMENVPSKKTSVEFDIQNTCDFLYLVRESVKLLAADALEEQGGLKPDNIAAVAAGYAEYGSLTGADFMGTRAGRPLRSVPDVSVQNVNGLPA